MKCICGSDAKCIDSRPTTRRDAVRRRRECTDCGRRFTTYELRADDLTCLPDPDEKVIRRDRNRVISELAEDGVPAEDIAEAFGLSLEWVQNLFFQPGAEENRGIG